MAFSISKEKLNDLYAIQMKKDQDIADIYGVARETVRRKRKKYGIKTIPRLKRNPLNEEVLRDLYEGQGLTDEEISNKYSYQSSYITSLRYKYGIETDKTSKRYRKLDPHQMHKEYEQEKLDLKELAEKHNTSVYWITKTWGELGYKWVFRQRKKSYNTLVFNKKANEIINGTLLGDAYLNRSSDKTMRLEMKHVSLQYEWLMWKAKALSDVLEFSISSMYPKSEFNGKLQYRAISKMHPEFREIYDDWYRDDGTKFISLDTCLSLSPLVIAIWLMDDGSLSKRRYTIYSQSFTKEENEILCEHMNNLFNFHAKIGEQRPNQWVIRFPVKDYDVLSSWLEHYFDKEVPSMRYKWGKDTQTTLPI